MWVCIWEAKRLESGGGETACETGTKRVLGQVCYKMNFFPLNTEVCVKQNGLPEHKEPKTTCQQLRQLRQLCYLFIYFCISRMTRQKILALGFEFQMLYIDEKVKQDSWM